MSKLIEFLFKAVANQLGCSVRLDPDLNRLEIKNNTQGPVFICDRWIEPATTYIFEDVYL